MRDGSDDGRGNTEQVKRRFFNLPTAVSLVLCVATLGVVAASHWYIQECRLGFGRHAAAVLAQGGTISLSMTSSLDMAAIESRRMATDWRACGGGRGRGGGAGFTLATLGDALRGEG